MAPRKGTRSKKQGSAAAPSKKQKIETVDITESGDEGITCTAEVAFASIAPNNQLASPPNSLPPSASAAAMSATSATPIATSPPSSTNMNGDVASAPSSSPSSSTSPPESSPSSSDSPSASASGSGGVPPMDLGTSSLCLMLKAIYQYLSQFGFEQTAQHLRLSIAERFQSSPHKPLNGQDEREGTLRVAMYRAFTLTSAEVSGLNDSAEVITDDVSVLASYANQPRTVDSQVFELEVMLRVLACMEVVDDEDESLFEEEVERYFPPHLLPTKEEQAAFIKASKTGKEALSDRDLRKQRLESERRQLLDYHQAKQTMQRAAKNSASYQAASQKLATQHARYSRQALEQSMRNFLRLMLERLHVKGEVLLERVAKDIQSGKYSIVDTDDEEEEDEEEEDEEEDEEEEEAEEEEDAGEAAASGQQEANGTQGTRDEDVAMQVEKVDAEAESAAPPVVRRGRGRPPKAATSTHRPEPTLPSSSPSSSSSSTASSRRPLPDIARTLQEASSRLKRQGEDPLAESLRATSSLSHASPSRKRKMEEEAEAEAEANEEEEMDEEEGETESAAPTRKGGRRPLQTSSKAARYDRPSATATKIKFDEDGEQIEVEGEGEGEEEKLPPFKAKRSGASSKIVPASASASSAAAAAASSSSGIAHLFDEGQRKRPAQHRHLTDRSVRRVPWTNDEIQKLTEGVMEFANEHKKWAMILAKYGEFFHDRTVVDLKDKWRNLKQKLENVQSGTSKGQRGGRGRGAMGIDNRLDEGMEDIDED